MSEQWYWKHGRDLLGPLETEALERLIRQKRVADRDRVRLADDEVWLSGADVKTLFAEQGADRTSSAAAARLLSQSARLREADAVAAGGRSSRIGGAVRGMLEIPRLTGGPAWGLLERLGELFNACFKLLRPMLNRYVLLAAVMLALTLVVAMNIHVGSDARNRRIYNELSQAQVELDGMLSRSASADALRTFSGRLMPALQRDLGTLIDDGRRSPGQSADSFSWMDSAERGWEVAHTRKALIQAIQSFLTLLETPPESIEGSPAREIFRQNMAVADDLLEGGLRQHSRVGDEGNWSPVTVGFLIVDGLLIVGGMWYWLRRR